MKLEAEIFAGYGLVIGGSPAFSTGAAKTRRVASKETGRGSV